MTALIKHAPDPFPPSYTTSVFPDLIKMLLVVDDQGILQNGQDAIKELVQRDISGLARWSDGAKPGLDYIISFIAKLLHPEQSESAGIFVGDLIIKLIQKVKHNGLLLMYRVFHLGLFDRVELII